VGDVVEAMKLGVEKKTEGFEVYNISAADTCSDWDSLKIAQCFYPDVPILDPEAFQRDKKKTLFKFSKAEKELGFKPRFSWREFMGG
jgi:nucleoside-diphosphate-sugar epimerase